MSDSGDTVRKSDCPSGTVTPIPGSSIRRWVASALVDAGREPPLHSLRAEAELAQAEAELKAAQAEALSTRFALGAMIPGEDVPVVGSVFPELRPPYSVLGD